MIAKTAARSLYTTGFPLTDPSQPQSQHVRAYSRFPKTTATYTTGTSDCTTHLVSIHYSQIRQPKSALKVPSPLHCIASPLINKRPPTTTRQPNHLRNLSTPHNLGWQTPQPLERLPKPHPNIPIALSIIIIIHLIAPIAPITKRKLLPLRRPGPVSHAI